MRKFIVTVNGKTYNVEVEERNGEGSRAENVLSFKEREKGQEATAGRSPATETVTGGQAVTAPLAGVILSVKVKVGDEVAPGTILGTLEALKLENEIVAPVAGKVAAVNVTQGQNVAAGDILFVLE